MVSSIFRGLIIGLLTMLVGALPGLGQTNLHEVHIVGIYEGFTRSDGQIHGPRASLTVDRPGQEVVLVLTNFDPVRWMVEVTPGTRLSAVYLGGQHAARSEILINGLAFPGFIRVLDIPMTYEAKGPKFRDLIKGIEGWTGQANLSSYYGHYTAPAEGIFVSRVDTGNTALLPDPLASKVRPLDAAPPAFRPIVKAQQESPAERPQMLRFKQDSVEVTLPGQESETFAYSLDVPDISWPVGSAYVPGERAVYIVTLGGEGFLYRLDVATGAWRVIRSMEQRDASHMMYDADRNRLLILVGRSIEFQDLSRGEVTSVPLQIENLAGAQDLASRSTKTEILAAAGDLILLRAFMYDPRDPRTIGTYRIWQYDLSRGTADLLAYR